MYENVDTTQPSPNIWEKFGYSLAGLLAGNLVETLAMMAAKAVPVFIGLTLRHNLNSETYSDLASLAFCVALFSFLGWVVVGLPVVGLLPVRWFRDLPFVVFIPIGACLGPLAFVFGIFVFGGVRALDAIETSLYFLILAAIISSTALTVFAWLVRAQKRRP